jgi:hypothetical protein
MDVEGGMDGPGFLDPIPEDVSVVAAASQHTVNLSTVSAVASSDSGGMVNTSASAETKKRPGGGRRRRKGDGRANMNTTDPTRTAMGAAGGRRGAAEAAMDDNVSDANASLGGANEHGTEVPLRTLPLRRSEVDDTPKSVLFSPSCKKKSLIFLAIVSVLAIAVGIGMYVIVVRMPETNELSASNNNSSSSSSSSSSSDGNNLTEEVASSPTPIPAFPSFEVSLATAAPTAPPEYSPEEIKVLDDAFVKVSGTTNENIFDMNTPEGKGRDWMINSDVAINVNEEQRVQQRYIMCVLHFATNGDFWNKKSNWLNAERSECDWYGISCNNENNIIQIIDLSENNVTGTLPNEIASLSNLVALNMSYDDISGTIPENFFDLLDELETLDMQENRLSGTISVTESRLRFLDLGNNALTGSFPFFPNAENLIFKRNNLTSIDDRYSTSSPSLKNFQGYHNLFSGPLPKIWNLPNLIKLDLSYNFWSGTIPQDLWNLPSLKSLLLGHCMLTGPLPDYSDSHSMYRLWVNSNQLSGSIPSRFGWNWTKLYSVKLQENLLTGSITPEQCDRWNPPNSTRGKHWKFNTDCQIDCACRTNNNCS